VVPGRRHPARVGQPDDTHDVALLPECAATRRRASSTRATNASRSNSTAMATTLTSTLAEPLVATSVTGLASDERRAVHVEQWPQENQ
jgi:hypothetical protein